MNPDVINRCESIRNRRTLLEALAQLLCQLQGASDGMSAIQNIILPSQVFSAAQRQKLATEINVYQRAATDELQARLAAFDQGLTKACQLFFRIAKLDDDAFIKRFQGGEEERKRFRVLQHQLTLFQQQANECLALRLVLQDRGVQLARCRLSLGQTPLSQELLANELQQLRQREKSHRLRLQQELRSMIGDTELLLKVAANNSQVGRALTVNLGKLELALALLEQNGVVAQLPELIEEIECDLLPEGFHTGGSFTAETGRSSPPPVNVQSAVSATPIQSDSSAASEPAGANLPATEAPANNPPLKANSFWVRLKIWTATSWNVSWADTKYFKP